MDPLPTATMPLTLSWSHWEGMEAPGEAPDHRRQAQRQALHQPPQHEGAVGEEQGGHQSSRKLQPELAAGSGNLTILASKQCFMYIATSCYLPDSKCIKSKNSWTKVTCNGTQLVATCGKIIV